MGNPRTGASVHKLTDSDRQTAAEIVRRLGQHKAAKALGTSAHTLMKAIEGPGLMLASRDRIAAALDTHRKELAKLRTPLAVSAPEPVEITGSVSFAMLHVEGSAEDVAAVLPAALEMAKGFGFGGGS